MTGTPKSAHTPGPWAADDKLSRYHQRYEDGSTAIVSESGEVVCNTTHGWEDGRKTAEANAQLIAAAPALLAALMEAESAIQELCNDQDPANECWAVLGRIRAAIAKVTGQ